MNNPINQLVTKKEIEDILNYFENIGDNSTRLEINKLNYYQEAFVHESYYQSISNILSNPGEPIYLDYKPKESNERLEYLGDHILKAVLGRYLYMRFPTEREGFLTKLKIKIEKCSMLHKFAATLGFKKYLLLSRQVENQTILALTRGRQSGNFLEDSFEAFIGAIYLDFGIEDGYKYCDRFIVSIIENVIDFGELISHNQNFKDSIQRYFQSNKLKLPQYITLCETGPLYRKIFTRIVYIDKNFIETNLSDHVKKKIKKYTMEYCNYYQHLSSDLYEKLLKEINKDQYILGIGMAQKVIEAEQEAAKMGLLNLGLDLNY